MRAQADAALSQFRIDDALRKAVLRQGRPTRLSYEPGELVAFWRHVKKKKGKILQPGWFRGTIVGPHKGDGSPGQSNYWVTSGGRLILVSKEQLRPTYGTERWRIQDADLENILAEFPEEYYDETGEPPPEDMVMEAFAEDDGEVVVPMYAPSVSYTPSLASTPEEAASGVQTPLGTDTTQPPTIRAPGKACSAANIVYTLNINLLDKIYVHNDLDTFLMLNYHQCPMIQNLKEPGNLKNRFRNQI